jgi:hypothetical protein
VSTLIMRRPAQGIKPAPCAQNATTGITSRCHRLTVVPGSKALAALLGRTENSAQAAIGSITRFALVSCTGDQPAGIPTAVPLHCPGSTGMSCGGRCDFSRQQFSARQGSQFPFNRRGP